MQNPLPSPDGDVPTSSNASGFHGTTLASTSCLNFPPSSSPQKTRSSTPFRLGRRERGGRPQEPRRIPHPSVASGFRRCRGFALGAAPTRNKNDLLLNGFRGTWWKVSIRRARASSVCCTTAGASGLEGRCSWHTLSRAPVDIFGFVKDLYLYCHEGRLEERAFASAPF